MFTRTFARYLLAMASVASLPLAQASTDISQTPLITNQVLTKPNVMFVLDNSGSMSWDYTPDALANTYSNDGASVTTRYGYRSAHCNGSAYNPATNYTLPVTPDGRRYPALPLTAAWVDGFRPSFSSSTNLTINLNTVLPANGTTVSVSLGTNLAVNTRVAFVNRANPALWLSGTVTSSAGGVNTIRLTFSTMHDGTKSNWTLGVVSTQALGTQYYYTYTGSQSRMNWAYNSSGALDLSSTFVQECRRVESSSNPSPVFSRVNVSGLLPTEQQNYANWYSYYRTRILTMRSAAGQAVASLDSSYRVGFNSLNVGGGFNTGVANSIGHFADIRDFDDAQRLVFFSNLYGSDPDGGTPLRRSLAKVGRYFGNKLTGQTDPVPTATLACQRNFTLLTTDGYWNDTSNPVRLEGAAIGNWDGSLAKTPRPMFDGTGDSVTIERTVTTVVRNSTGCGSFLNRTPLYRHTVQERTVTVKAELPIATSTATAWVTTGVFDNCNSSYSVSNTVVSTGGVDNTLADVAAYYRAANLSRPQNEPADKGAAALPLMTTYTLGFGVSGLLRYNPAYLAQVEGDFADLKAGRKTWPVPTSNSATTVDDLWHAAVNGGGQYYAATDPTQLAQSLNNAFKSIQEQTGSGASAASSSLRPVLGTDQIFVGSYRTKFWDGDLKAFTLTDGVTRFTDDPDWAAREMLNSVPAANRRIYYLGRSLGAGGGETRALTPFTYQDLSQDADASTLTDHFNNLCSKPSIPSQCSRLTASERTQASGANLVDYIRGARSFESNLYRERTYVLGPIVDASPVYVGKPPFSYRDAGYNAFQAAQAARCPVVYAAANDGMLHAFSALPKPKTNAATSATTTTADASDVPECSAGGTELWAYVPRAVMGELYRLTDTDYAANHRFFVNGTPVVGDISLPAESTDDTPEWRTILVGGFGAGGKGYYALDITDPASPAAMWEFADADMGLSYGNPVITKVPDANGTLTWVVAFTSGLNNSGNGFLYILNARTGQVMYKIPTLAGGTAVGTLGAPSGLNKLNAWIDQPSDNTALRLYAGDMLGNLWRFNTDSAAALAAPATASGADARSFRVARFVADGRAQPITVRPELAKIENQAVVLVGTGRYLGVSDASDLDSTQSIYGIKDPISSSTGWGDVRATTGALVAQTLTTLAADAAANQPERRQISSNAVDWARAGVAGWYLDLPDDGERVIVPMSLAFDTLTLATLVPSTSPCSGSGYSWLFDLNIRTGSFVSERTSDQVAARRYDQAIMGISTLQVAGEKKTRQTITKADGSVELRDHVNSPSSQGGLRRTSWRELLPAPR